MTSIEVSPVSVCIDAETLADWINPATSNLVSYTQVSPILQFGTSCVLAADSPAKFTWLSSKSSKSSIIESGPYAVIKMRIKIGITRRMDIRSMSVTFHPVRPRILASRGIGAHSVATVLHSNLRAVHRLEEEQALFFHLQQKIRFLLC